MATCKTCVHWDKCFKKDGTRYYGPDCACNNVERLCEWFFEKGNGVTVQECGEWEEIEDDWNMETIYKCSACKEEFVTIDGTPADNLWNYCPNCGAKMMPQPPKEGE